MNILFVKKNYVKRAPQAKIFSKLADKFSKFKFPNKKRMYEIVL